MRRTGSLVKIALRLYCDGTRFDGTRSKKRVKVKGWSCWFCRWSFYGTSVQIEEVDYDYCGE